jgi:hypothetical protein
MNSATAIARYQASELAIRWRSQPASPMARWFLTFALSAAAGVLLLGFAAAESARRAELRRLGLDTIVIQAPAQSLLSEGASLPPDHWASPLATQGDLLLLQQLAEPAYTPWADPMPVFVGSVGLERSMGFQPMSSIEHGLEARATSQSAAANLIQISNSAFSLPTWYTHTLSPGRLVRPPPPPPKTSRPSAWTISSSSPLPPPTSATPSAAWTWCFFDLR